MGHNSLRTKFKLDLLFSFSEVIRKAEFAPGGTYLSDDGIELSLVGVKSQKG
jgi:hypothetical protein